MYTFRFSTTHAPRRDAVRGPNRASAAPELSIASAVEHATVCSYLVIASDGEPIPPGKPRVARRPRARRSMTDHKWGPEGPPQEAYSRITNPERFAPLHAFATELLASLMLEYDVERRAGYDLDSTLRPSELARPSVMLSPRADGAAPLQLSFTRFPGLAVRAGHWYRGRFPACGCERLRRDRTIHDQRIEVLGWKRDGRPLCRGGGPAVAGRLRMVVD